jgi:hypothetical protein
MKVRALSQIRSVYLEAKSAEVGGLALGKRAPSPMATRVHRRQQAQVPVHQVLALVQVHRLLGSLQQVDDLGNRWISGMNPHAKATPSQKALLELVCLTRQIITRRSLSSGDGGALKMESACLHLTH